MFYQNDGCFILFEFLVAALLLAGGVFVLRAECNAKTADIGYPSRWALIGGCQIEVTDGQWIPLEQWYFRSAE